MKIGVHFNYQNYTDWERFESKADGEPAISDQQLYEEELALGSQIEPLGFDSYWAIDHHFSPYIMTGGALQHLTYFAGKTERIDFGTMVIVLPWYDPVMIAEHVSVLDNMLQGRKLTLGLGRGAAKREFDAYRSPMGESRARFLECLEILRKALSNEWFSHEGEFYTIPETTIRPRPRNAQQLIESMKVAWVSPDTLPIAANAGLGMLMTNQKSWDEYAEDVRGFNSVRAEHGWDPLQPTVVANVACFDTEEEAWDTLVKHTVEAQQSVENHYRFSESARFSKTEGYKFYENFGKALDKKTPQEIGEFNAKPQAWGTPDQVFEKLKNVQRTTGAGELIVNFRQGGMPAATSERNMQLFAKEVLPRLHQLDTPLPTSMTGVAAK
jgi:alkanesulfonate monooxygenase SsuD/methylene tetrahydromethanopterin reductase-like flavin-dependent oxidoreductase (luciferase family)